MRKIDIRQPAASPADLAAEAAARVAGDAAEAAARVAGDAAPRPRSASTKATTDLGSPLAHSDTWADSGVTLSFTPTGSVILVSVALGVTVWNDKSTVRVVIGGSIYALGYLSTVGLASQVSRTIRHSGLTPGTPVDISIQYTNAGTGTLYLRAAGNPAEEFAEIVATDAQ